MTVLILIFAILVMIFTVVSVNTVGEDKASLFGYKPYIVLSDSMNDVFAIGDMTVSREVDPETLEVGDIVTFSSIDPSNYEEVVTHKIREITTYEGGPAFITYGTATGVDDAYPVPFENVIGEYQFRLPKLGYVFQFLRTPLGYLTIILAPFLLLIILQTVRFFRLAKKYKMEQQAEIAAQRAAVDAQLQEAQQMKMELEWMREQMMEPPMDDDGYYNPSDEYTSGGDWNDYPY